MEQMITQEVSKNFLWIPVCTGSKKIWVDILADGDLYAQIEVEQGTIVDFYAYMDITKILGKSLSINSEQPLALGWQLQNDMPPTKNEVFRPRLHFTSRYGWLNDPNGLFEYEGLYHLFYQHNPYGTSWGNMHWGHATSLDLLNWKEHGDVLFPDETGTMFSGCAVVDNKNDSGLGVGCQPAILLYYTAAGDNSPQNKGKHFEVYLAVSQDGGQHFEKRGGEPLLNGMQGADRDPKVIWVEELQQWLLAIYRDGHDSHTYWLYTSSNLLDWTYLDAVELPADAECPDIIPLYLDGDATEKRWLLWGASGYYRIGRFVQKEWVLEKEVLKATCYEKYSDYYAAQTFYSEAERSAGTALQFSWLRLPTANASFNMQMGFPVRLRLISCVEGERLSLLPAQEAVAALLPIGTIHRGTPRAVQTLLTSHDLATAYAVIQLPDVAFRLQLGTSELAYAEGCLVTPIGTLLLPKGDGIQLRVLTDGDLVEVFAQNGRCVFAFKAASPCAIWKLEVLAGDALINVSLLHKTAERNSK